MRSLLRRLARDDGGQDIVEYALLAAFVGLAGIVGISAIGTALAAAYAGWDAASQDLWIMPPPGGGP